MERKHYLAAAALAGLFVAAGSIEFAGVASAHSSDFTLTPHCATAATWVVHYSGTATNPELNPVAFIANSNDPLGPVPGTFQTDFIVPTSEAHFTASVHWVWSDGFTKDVGPKTVDRPNCPPPTTTTSEVTTSPTTAPTSTPPTTVTPSSTSPSVTTVAGSLPTISTPPTHNASPIATSKPSALPPTGASDWILLFVAIGAFLVIAGIVLTTAKRVDRWREGD